MREIQVVDRADVPTIANWLEERIVDALGGSKGMVAITVPGGSTPFPIFEELVRREIDFSRLSVWPGDDRIVAEDHPASNTGKIRALFEAVGARVVTLTDLPTVPRFALTWLGMGADGHVASLFPNTDPDPQDEEAIRRLTPDPLPPEAPFDRITLTIPSLLNSQHVMLTLGGSEEKRAVFDAAIAGQNDLPIARLLTAAHQPITCFS